MVELNRQSTALSARELLGPLNEVEQKYAPKQLWIAGDQSILASGPRVAVIGSRKVSDVGRANTERLCRFLVQHGVVVVSGLAEGVDAAAHGTAIQSDGKTIAVLGTPLDQCYPPQNRKLQDVVMREHLAVSQFPPGSAVQRGNFPIRNRLMALLSHASIIVEAGDTSGSLHQGWEALRLGRPLFILQQVIENTSLTWPAKMIPYGATVLSPTKFEEVLEALPPSGAALHADIPV